MVSCAGILDVCVRVSSLVHSDSSNAKLVWVNDETVNMMRVGLLITLLFPFRCLWLQFLPISLKNHPHLPLPRRFHSRTDNSLASFAIHLNLLLE